MNKKEFLDNSPVFKKWYSEWVEKLKGGWAREQARGIEMMRKAQYERHALIVFVLVALAVIAATGALLNQYGSYCEYPDPYGR